MELALADEAATLALGRALAVCLAGPTSSGSPVAVLLTGDLGAGKTTLVRGAVAALPGADEAEVASPSFNIVNIYPTAPRVTHFDLYRLEGRPLDDELEECLNAPETLAFVEWAQYLDKRLLSASSLSLTWLPAASGRRVEITADGEAAIAALTCIERELAGSDR